MLTRPGELDLSYGTLFSKFGRDRPVLRLIGYLTEHPEIKKVNLAGNHLDAKDAALLANNKTLEELNLYGNQIGSAGAIAIATYNTALRKLNVGHNQIDVNGVVALGESKVNQIETLDLSSNKLYDLGNAFRNNTKITSLDLCFNPLKDKACIDGLVPNTTLKTINLSWTLLYDDAIIALAKHSHVTDLQVQNTYVSDKCTQEIAANTYLTKVNLAFTLVTDYGIAKIAKSKSIVSLDLSKRSLDDSALKPFETNETIKELSLRGNYITDAGVPSLCKMKSLEHLIISHNQLSLDGIKALAKKLNVGNYQLCIDETRPDDEKACKAWSQGLKVLDARFNYPAINHSLIKSLLQTVPRTLSTPKAIPRPLNGMRKS